MYLTLKDDISEVHQVCCGQTQHCICCVMFQGLTLMLELEDRGFTAPVLEAELSGLKRVGVKAVSVVLLTLFWMNFYVSGNQVFGDL